MFKVLNLYAGIGGNRRLWENVEVTAVEYNKEIAAIYQEYFPNDKVIVADAHEYLLQHYKEFDFIWSSPPCQTHSSIRASQRNTSGFIPLYPDMKLWQEIIFLQNHSICPYIVENVFPYYEVFIPYSIEFERHLFWSNVKLTTKDVIKNDTLHVKVKTTDKIYGFDISQSKLPNKVQVLRNLVNPEIGLALLDQVRNITRPSKVKQLNILDDFLPENG